MCFFYCPECEQDIACINCKKNTPNDIDDIEENDWQLSVIAGQQRRAMTRERGGKDNDNQESSNKAGDHHTAARYLESDSAWDTSPAGPLQNNTRRITP